MVETDVRGHCERNPCRWMRKTSRPTAYYGYPGFNQKIRSTKRFVNHKIRYIITRAPTIPKELLRFLETYVGGKLHCSTFRHGTLGRTQDELCWQDSGAASLSRTQRMGERYFINRAIMSSRGRRRFSMANAQLHTFGDAQPNSKLESQSAGQGGAS